MPFIPPRRSRITTRLVGVTDIAIEERLRWRWWRRRHHRKPNDTPANAARVAGVPGGSTHYQISRQSLRIDSDMERLHRTVVQLEEAKRFILSGDVPHLALALILLDNAAEVMMRRVVEDELDDADMYARMLERLPAVPLDAKARNGDVNSRPASCRRNARKKFADTSQRNSSFSAKKVIEFRSRPHAP